MSRASGSCGRSPESCPTLPPIRDLFSAELSLRNVHESPAVALARLSVRDHDIMARRGSFDGVGDGLRTSDFGLFSLKSSHPSARFMKSAPSLHYGSPESRSHSRSSSFSSDFFHHQSHSSRDSLHEDDNDFEPLSFYRVERRSTHPNITIGLPREKRLSLDVGMYSQAQTPYSSGRPFPRAIATEFAARRLTEDDDDPTPVARFRDSGPKFEHRSAHSARPSAQGIVPSATAFKYECTYCGKGFNRPSSLKIHINSHTGEKPFVCTVEGCGRSFSVLSNMRRHARVHTHVQAQPESSGDETSEIPSTPPLSASSQSSIEPLRRRDSFSSIASSTSSRRSRSLSCDDGDELDNEAPPGKKSRSYRHH